MICLFESGRIEKFGAANTPMPPYWAVSFASTRATGERPSLRASRAQPAGRFLAALIRTEGAVHWVAGSRGVDIARIESFSWGLELSGRARPHFPLTGQLNLGKFLRLPKFFYLTRVRNLYNCARRCRTV
jgi:hypothetical protein